jgi:two-component system sensor histidine kinase TorS
LESTLSATKETESRLQQESAERQRLAASLDEIKRELQNQARRRETLELELQTTQKSLQDCEAKLAEQTAERLRLAEALDAAQRGAYDGSERDLEFSKVQSALQLEQVERKRQEGQLARTRQRALDAARAARALRTSMRRQIREPVENLVNSARSLLELEMGEAQKQLAEAVLQDVLLVQTRLRDPGLAHGDSHDTTTLPKPSDS